MKPGHGKQKGSAFEREVCKALSLWITKGKRGDCFWRSAMSGGRATVRGMDVRQAGDICAVSPEGHMLTDPWYIECKHVRDLSVTEFMVKGTGLLQRFWSETVKRAEERKKAAVLIARQNNLPTLFLCRPYTLEVMLKSYPTVAPRAIMPTGSIYLFDHVLTGVFRDASRSVHLRPGRDDSRPPAPARVRLERPKRLGLLQRSDGSRPSVRSRD